ncbi:serine hydrolase [Sphaerisporangium siamense]|uniref:Beta-lactamase class A n=1 Tax=Sphaerisporangium siamense TaxID=795645 RepID=A0A7W7D4Q1_9ACTN|nr:serine hydrolase [Sphaerisporangium siamense]MBB4698811.1 beta-lactamase class A [Sphaerisporangium siamense]GII89148.1 serine hydrolase [Sphaerisporangium siamense]
MSAAPSAGPAPDLEVLARECPGTLAVAVPGMLAVNENAELPLASVGKLLLLAEVARAVVSGSLDPGEVVALREEDHCGGSGLLGGLSAGRWTVGDLALLTASVSDNTATNALLRRVGIDRVNAGAAELGFRRTRILDRIREPRLPAHPPTFAVGTAAELAAFAARLAEALSTPPATPASGSPPASGRPEVTWERALAGWMAHNTDRSLVPALLPHEPEDREIPAAPPPGTVWVANKTGTDAGTRTDVGVMAGRRWLGYAVLAHGPAGAEHALVTAARRAGLAVGALALRVSAR